MQIHNDNVTVDAGFDALDYSFRNYSASDGNIRIRGEHQLWSAVLYQALCDLQVKEERAEVERWFFRKNDDFPLVCALAGLDPVTVQQEAMKRISRANTLPCETLI